MRLSRLAACAASTVAALALTGLAAAPAAHAAQPGVAGPEIVLGAGIGTTGGMDVVTDPSTGTAYVGWISSGTGDAQRVVHLCVLPAGATACAGGVLKSAALTDWQTAAGLHLVVLSPGTVTAVWYHTGASATGHLTSLTYAGGSLSAPLDSTVPAPVNGSLEDVQLGPDGQIWAVTEDAASLTNNVLTVRDGLNATPTPVPVAFSVSHVQLAFNGTQAILAFGRSGQVGEPVRVASAPAYGVSEVAGTWQVGPGYDVVGTSTGARLVSSIADSSYHPVSSAWNGSTFVGPTTTGDVNSCAPSTHDLVTDGSGRVADVSNECSTIAVANLADTRHAGVVRFDSGGIIAGYDPQIATFANGSAWVAWGIEQNGVTGDTLLAAPVLLPGPETVVTAAKAKNSVSVTGPGSCLPAVSAPVSAKATASKHWKLVSTSLTLDGHVVPVTGSVDGASFGSGTTHALVGKAVFKKKAKKKHHHHGHHRVQAGKPHHHAVPTKTVSDTLTFRVC